VLRPDLSLPWPEARRVLFRQITALADLGLQQVEIAWHDHPGWGELVAACRERCPQLRFGAASITRCDALERVHELDLAFAISPVLDEALLARAAERNLALVPGVFSPSEVHRARSLGCRIVKLFPADRLGPGYWSRLAAPLGPLPRCIAAGGLAAADVPGWLARGVDAVALGRTLFRDPHAGRVDPLLVDLVRRPGPALTRGCTDPAGAADDPRAPGTPSPPPSARP
jgi:2-dehydro-3-deoxyphosphogluconate aldolase/(4S)-4-hydroxy-2-oxoglutarate aldolase